MNVLKKLWHAIGRHKYTITIVGFLLIICFLDQNNLLLRLRHHRQISELKSEKEFYTKMRDESIEGLKELEENETNLERIARDKYGMHLPDEEVFIIKD